MVPLDRLEQIKQRFEFIEAQMSQGGGDVARLGREYSELRPVVEDIRAYLGVLADLEGAREMLADAEMRDLARAEIETLETRLMEMERKLHLALLPRDAADA